MVLNKPLSIIKYNNLNISLMMVKYIFNISNNNEFVILNYNSTKVRILCKHNLIINGNIR